MNAKQKNKGKFQLLNKDALVKAMNLSSLKPQGKFQPLFTKKLRDPQQILNDDMVHKIDFNVEDQKRRGKISK